MFTGLVEEKGEVLSFHEQPEAWRMRVRANLVAQELELGDSVAINGCCLSVVAISKTILTFDVLEETRRLTNLKNIDLGSKVNLERSLRFNGRVGGHFLTGHVDGLGKIVELGMRAKDVILKIEVPREFEHYLVYKGCIGIDGISLTVAEVEENVLAVWLIPHTLQVTGLGDLKRGDKVNLEFDLLAKYTEKILSKQER